MTPRQIFALIAIATAIIVGSAWFFTSGSEPTRLMREANVAIEAAAAQGQVADAKAVALMELTKEPDLATGREAIVAAAKEAAAESKLVLDRYVVAANLAHAVVESADTEVVKTYWRFQRDSLSKLGEEAKASASGYAVWEDPAIADRKTAVERIAPFEDEAEAARAEADRLAAAAKAYRAEHRREL